MSIPIVGLVISSLVTMYVGIGRTIHLIDVIINEGTVKPVITSEILSLIDIYLIATVQVVTLFGMTSLFFGFSPAQKVYNCETLTELKATISELIILVVAVRFVELLFAGKKGTELLYASISIVMVGAMLIAFTLLSFKHTGEIHASDSDSPELQKLKRPQENGGL